MNTYTPSTGSNIYELIERMTDETWKTTGKALLIARLGQALRLSGYDLKAILGKRKLVAVLKEEMEDKVQVITSPTDKLVHAVLPKSIPISMDLSIYFGSNTSQESKKVAPQVQFHKKLWLAFTRPLAPTATRKFSFTPDLEFTDEIGTSTGQGTEIPQRLIITTTALPKTERDNLVQNNILEWLNENQISVESVKARSEVAGREDKFKKHRSVLDLVFETIPTQDLKRISMPLDVIKSLMEKKLGGE